MTMERGLDIMSLKLQHLEKIKKLQIEKDAHILKSSNYKFEE